MHHPSLFMIVPLQMISIIVPITGYINQMLQVLVLMIIEELHYQMMVNTFIVLMLIPWK